MTQVRFTEAFKQEAVRQAVHWERPVADIAGAMMARILPLHIHPLSGPDLDHSGHDASSLIKP